MNGVAPTIAGLGGIVQHGYVPRDVPKALDYWINRIGAGPFFHLPHVDYREARYRGAAVRPDFSLWLGHWQDLQIELIEQHCDTPSIYAVPRDDLHHVCILVDDMAAARAVCTVRGATLEQENLVDGGAAAYLDTGDPAGVLLELVQRSPAIDRLFGRVRQASIGWDGRDPIRSIHDIRFR